MFHWATFVRGQNMVKAKTALISNYDIALLIGLLCPEQWQHMQTHRDSLLFHVTCESTGIEPGAIGSSPIRGE
jgi:hypothetical protein